MLKLLRVELPWLLCLPLLLPVDAAAAGHHYVRSYCRPAARDTSAARISARSAVSRADRNNGRLARPARDGPSFQPDLLGTIPCARGTCLPAFTGDESRGQSARGAAKRFEGCAVGGHVRGDRTERAVSSNPPPDGRRLSAACTRVAVFKRMVGEVSRCAQGTGMAYLGLVPGEHSSGERHRRGPITKTGNTLARRLVVEAAWHYRHRPGVSRTLAQRRSGQPPRVIALADKAQQRLCRRFRRLAEHKPGPVVTVAVGFLWAALHPETV